MKMIWLWLILSLGIVLVGSVAITSKNRPLLKEGFAEIRSFMFADTEDKGGGTLPPIEENPISSQTQVIKPSFAQPAYSDLSLTRKGDKLNITFGGEYATIRGYFFYEGNTFTFAQASSYGVTYDSWVNYNTGTSSKFGGKINTSNVPQAILDNGYFVVFELVDKSEGLTYRKEGDSIYLNDNVRIVWKDYANLNNKFEIYNSTTVYLTDNGEKFHNTLIYDPEVLVGNKSIGINNNTYYNSTDDTLRLNLTLGNGTYISQVFSINGSFNTSNLTVNSFSTSGYEVKGSVRTWNKTNFTKDLRVFMPFIEYGKSTATDQSGDNFPNVCTVQNQANFNLNNNTYFPLSNYDGTNDWLSCTYSDLNNTAGLNMTVCAVLYTNNNAITQNLIWIINNGLANQLLRIQMALGKMTTVPHGCGGVSTSNVEVLNKTFVHFCTVFDNNADNILMYINGSVVSDTGGCNEDWVGNATRFNIGTRDNGNNLDWNGSIGFFRFYFNALTPSEIQNIYESDYLPNVFTSFQSFSSGVDTHNFNISTDSKFIQVKTELNSDGVTSPIIYGFNSTLSNYSYPSGEEPPTDSCTCTEGSDWNIVDGDICVLTTECDIRSNYLRVTDGKLRINSGGILVAKGCYVAQGSGMYTDNLGRNYCGG